MSGPKHTPGPWEVFEHSIVHDLKRLDDNRIQADWIAEIDHMNQADCDDEGYSETAQANALLIAAAPRLAEALRNLLAQVPDSGHPHDALRAEIDAARAALREAGQDDA